MSAGYFYTCVLSFLSGVLLHSFVEISIFTSLWLLLLSLIMAIYWRRYDKGPYAGLIVCIILAASGSALGIERFRIVADEFASSPLRDDVGKEVVYTGVVIREPEVREQTKHLVLEMVDGNRVLVIADRHSKGSYGSNLTVFGTLDEPESFTTELGRTFHYPEYLRARGIGHIIMFPDSITEHGSASGNLLLAALYNIKASFTKALTSVLPEPAAGLGLGVLLGIKQALGEELETAFRTAGIIHIVVLSGYNVMLVVAAIMYLLARIFSLKTRAVTGIFAIVAFALLVGLGATVVRASIMAGIILLSLLLGRRYNVLRALCLAGLAMVIYQPYVLAFDIGFQLSFMATLGLIFVAPQFETMVEKMPQRWGAKDFLSATIATQIAVLPLLVFHIGEVSLIAIVVNVLVLPIVPFAMLATAVTGVVAMVNVTAGTLIGLVANLLLTIIVKIALWSAAIPFASILIPPVPWQSIPVFYLLLGTAFYLRWSGKKPFQFKDDTVVSWTIEEESALFEKK